MKSLIPQSRSWVCRPNPEDIINKKHWAEYLTKSPKNEKPYNRKRLVSNKQLCTWYYYGKYIATFFWATSIFIFIASAYKLWTHGAVLNTRRVPNNRLTIYPNR